MKTTLPSFPSITLSAAVDSLLGTIRYSAAFDHSRAKADHAYWGKSALESMSSARALIDEAETELRTMLAEVRPTTIQHDKTIATDPALEAQVMAESE